EAVAMAQSLMPDVLILDLMMPELNGLEVIQEVKRAQISTEIVIFTMHKDTSYFLRAVRSGSLGYVLKDSPTDELIEAVRTVAAKHYFVCQVLADLAPASMVMRSGSDILDRYKALTPREQEIFKLTAQGLTSMEIGQELNISRRTVEVHRYHLRLKLKLKNSVDLARMAMRYGLLEPNAADVQRL
ncbi:MAG: LuxR C-terminal-related transcriptional regulator, partial [Chloroflexota bacterium]